ncbi:polysaccharide biosynthesis family protein [Yersinia kristensenii]|uniref:Polysaccharide biosynthesis family protein n=2 Tax=Yersinia kristensenii TaxID=28152 RepID=Q0H787_YERKR|nr:oligosaccharide flippase family protein [Yersinia kristensenii]ABB04472.1 putative O antigen flippase [Yersinia kristensenii]OVZ81221.1 polysaccharide biosynthesis family protein [Yersinia kristensenii]PJG63180.1 polysaccharide biosynthesis family protein [Yersinia kristensenii]
MSNNNLFKSILIYGCITGASRMLPILLLPFYLSAIPIEDYGRIEVLVALFNFIIIFGSIQLETAVQRYMYKVKNKLNYAYALLMVIFLLSIIVFFIIFIFSNQISIVLFGSGIESINITIIALSCLFFNLSSIFLIYFRYSEQEGVFYIITLSQVFVTALITYILVVIEKLGNFGYVMGIFSGWLMVFFLGTVLILWKTKGGRELHADFSFLKQSIDFSLPQIPARIGSFFIQFGNRFIVLYYFGPKVVALLGLSVKFAAPFQLLYIAFTMAWNPYLYKNENSNDLEGKINKILKLLLLFIVVSSIAIHYIGCWIIDVYFHNGYEGVKALIFLAILPSGLLIVKDILETGVKLSGKTKYISYSYFLSIVITIILMIFSKNIQDILMSSLVGTIVLLLSTFIFSEREYHIKYSRSVFFFLLSSLVMAIISIITVQWRAL